MTTTSHNATPPPPPPKAQAARPKDPKQQALDTIKKWIGTKADTLETLLGSPEAAKRFGQVLILACLRNPALLTCDLKSLFLAALYCAQRGLEPGVSDGCALVPYKGKVTPIPQYRALVKQAVETGSVKSAKAILIHANDAVDWEEGENPRFIHKPAPFGQDRGPVVGAYSRIILPDGTKEIEPMDLQEIYKRRDASAAWRDSRNREATPWAQWEKEMIRKTALKNGLRTIPVSPRLRDLLESDNKLEGGAPVEAVLDDTIDVTVADEAQETQPQTKADALADMLTEEPTEQTTAEATPEPEPEDGQADTQTAFEKIRKAAHEAGATADLLKHFKLDSIDDLQAFPELLPLAGQFVADYKAQQNKKGKK